MKWILIAVIATLAGCATSPQEVIERGTRFTGEIAKRPMEAALCIAKNAEYSGNYLATVTGTDATEVELILRSSAVAYFTLALWRFHPSGTQATYEAWVSGSYLPNHAELLKQIRGNC